jgi:hypothetical protein
MLTQVDYLYIFSAMNKRLSKDKQALVLAALCEGEPIEAVARMFKIGTYTITRVIRETGEAFTDYMDKEFRDLSCARIKWTNNGSMSAVMRDAYAAPSGLRAERQNAR